MAIYPQVNIGASIPGKLVYLNQDCVMDHVALREKQPFEFGQYRDEDEYIKLLVYGENSELLKLEQLIREEFSEYMDCSFSAPYYLEVLPKCNKGLALQWIIDNLHIDRAKVIGVGDYDNDIELIHTAGLGVAVANGTDGAKAASDLVICDNNHDAIKELLDEVL